MQLGAHLPTSKGFLHALERSQELRCTSLQLFSKSPRQWKAAPLDLVKVDEFRAARDASACQTLAVHDSYLINLAAPDPDKLEKSLEAMIIEIERAELLGSDYLVTHCGAFLNKGEEEKGVKRLAQSLEKVLEATPDAQVKIALENTCGQGTCLGGPFEQLAEVLQTLNTPRLAVCFDTCHAFAYGHPLSSAEEIDQTLESFDRTIGLQNLALIHFNDSKGDAGKRLDRHEHIGQGKIGIDALRYFINHPDIRERPIILETPEVETMVETNLNKVRELRNNSA